MASNIVITGATRANLLSLQNTTKLLETTQKHLSTGLKVTSALENPTSYFTGQSLNSRASDLANLKDLISNSIQVLKAADTGIKSIQSLVSQAKSLANSAKATTDATTRANYAAQFDNLRTQINQLVTDTGFNGVNILNGDDLSVDFNEDGTSSLSITGVTYDSAGLAISASAGSWATDANVDAALATIDTASTTLQDQARTFGTNLAVIQTRDDFMSGMINVLRDGAGALVNADPSEEAANFLALQTRQALANNALALGAQAEQSILSLFR